MDRIIEKEFYKRLEDGRLFIEGIVEERAALHFWKMSWYACMNWDINNKEQEELDNQSLDDIEALVTGGN